MLPDMFKKFRKSSLNNYGLCLSHYLSASARDAKFNMSKVELEVYLDADMYLFFEQGIGGDVLYISKRYNNTNNKYFKSSDPKQETKHIVYLDINTLYGYATPKFLRTNRLKLIDPKEFDINMYTRNSSKGCVLKELHEVDFKTNLHVITDT